MRKKLILMVFPVIITVLSACQSPNSQDTSVTTHHNSMLSLDWAGAYHGVLPCADCEGLQTMIQLNKDSTFNMETQYVGRSPDVTKTQGTFSWDETGNIVALQSSDKNSRPTFYHVGEGRLIQLDADKKSITGNLADKYVLTKLSDIVERYWKLVELKGKQVTTTDKFDNEPHMIFKAIDSRVFGNAGCNNFTGKYELKRDNQLTFSGVASTRMLCIDMTTEDQFLKIFQMTLNYSLAGGNLLLKDSTGTILTKFVPGKPPTMPK
ncbi:MAG: hypothetical protein C5B59_10240 [Bacteroidetes bacterium]|nr:MAG: hypothetical protein C5B59_10240 [Bacteroidota bacterium]